MLTIVLFYDSQFLVILKDVPSRVGLSETIKAYADRVGLEYHRISRIVEPPVVQFSQLRMT